MSQPVSPDERATADAALALRRLTTEYVESEDRLRIAAETSEGQTVVLWVTQRLMLRLVPALLNWLQPDKSEQTKQTAQHAFAQEEARARLARQPAVVVEDLQAQSRVDAVDLTLAATSIQLRWRGPDLPQPVAVVMEPLPLRQWLGIVHQQFAQAQWPMSVWPAWMSAGAATTEPRQPPVRTTLH
jgi:hypothetical protein